MDLSVYSPVSLPNDGDNFVGRQGLVSGEQPLATIKENSFYLTSGWGGNGIDPTSVDNLTKASVDIVDSNNCLQQLNLDANDVGSLFFYIYFNP